MNTEQIAKIIFDIVYEPGSDDGEGRICPAFEVAKEDGYGLYDLAVKAAQAVIDEIPSLASQLNEAERKEAEQSMGTHYRILDPGQTPG